MEFDLFGWESPSENSTNAPKRGQGENSTRGTRRSKLGWWDRNRWKLQRVLASATKWILVFVHQSVSNLLILVDSICIACLDWVPDPLGFTESNPLVFALGAPLRTCVFYGKYMIIIGVPRPLMPGTWWWTSAQDDWFDWMVNIQTDMNRAWKSFLYTRTFNNWQE